MSPTFPFYLEEKASELSASLFMPHPYSGKISFRLSRFHENSCETIIDIYQSGTRLMIQVTRFLTSLRKVLGNLNFQDKLLVKREISYANLDCTDPMVREMSFNSFSSLPNQLEDTNKGDHFFLFFTDSKDCIVRSTTNPYQKSDTEGWQRIINRSFGTEHVPPRRNKNLVCFEK